MKKLPSTNTMRLLASVLLPLAVVVFFLADRHRNAAAHALAAERVAEALRARIPASE
jgi:hypothetical protein